MTADCNVIVHDESPSRTRSELMKHLCRFCSLLLGTVVIFGAGTFKLAADDQPQRGDVSVAAYSSIQAAVDANPNRMVYVPAGDYPISAKIRIHKDRSGLFGPGRIIQQNPEQPIVEIENSADVEVRDLTLTRPEGNQDTSKEGILSINCRHLVIENVRVVDNRTLLPRSLCETARLAPIDRRRSIEIVW